MHRVTVLTGAFGAGKTTVLRSLLAQQPSTERITIINEIGIVSPEVAGFQVQQERATVLCGGCLCCARRDDLVDALRDYAGRVPPERDAAVLIELSGGADAAPVVHTVTNDPFLANHYRMKEVITVVDPMHLPQGGESDAIWARQVSLADRCIISKADLVSEERLRAAEDLVAVTNPLAQVWRGADGTLKVRPAAAEVCSRRAGQLAGAAVAAHGELPDVTVIGLPGVIEWGRFSVWLSLLLHRWGQDVLRVKGVVAGDPGQRTSIEAVHHVVYPPRHVEAPEGAAPGNEVVLMTRGLPTDCLVQSLHVFLGICYGAT